MKKKECDRSVEGISDARLDPQVETAIGHTEIIALKLCTFLWVRSVAIRVRMTLSAK